jgi:flavin-binding protein dodecin
MAGRYKITELVGTSPMSFAEARKAAVAEAAKTIHHMEWFEVAEENGRLKGGKVEEFQVRPNIGFTIER